jgi:hypothetical protein
LGQLSTSSGSIHELALSQLEPFSKTSVLAKRKALASVSVVPIEISSLMPSQIKHSVGTGKKATLMIYLKANIWQDHINVGHYLDKRPNNA